MDVYNSPRPQGFHVLLYFYLHLIPSNYMEVIGSGQLFLLIFQGRKQDAEGLGVLSKIIQEVDGTHSYGC